MQSILQQTHISEYNFFPTNSQSSEKWKLNLSIVLKCECKSINSYVQILKWFNVKRSDWLGVLSSVKQNLVTSIVPTTQMSYYVWPSTIWAECQLRKITCVVMDFHPVQTKLRWQSYWNWVDVHVINIANESTSTLK